MSVERRTQASSLARCWPHMRDVYRRGADDSDTPACLRTVSPRRRSARAAPGPPPLRRAAAARARAARDPPPHGACELAADAAALDGPAPRAPRAAPAAAAPAGAAVCGEEELPAEALGGAGGGAGPNRGARAYCTLPRALCGVAAALYRDARLPPRRTTPDGTDIYYWCDLPRRRPGTCARPTLLLSYPPTPLLTYNIFCENTLVNPARSANFGRVTDDSVSSVVSLTIHDSL